MNDLYSLSQILKHHPLFRTHRDEILHLYFELGVKKNLAADTLMDMLSEKMPELFLALKLNHDLFKKHYEEAWRLRQDGVQLVCYGEDLYPRSCYMMEDPPITLSYLGTAAWLNERSLSVVGSREPCFESTQWMEKEFSNFCERARPTIVSGGARGIDQKAHALALRHCLSTIVVLPSGLGNLYPESLKEWRDVILEKGGCFLSEYAYDQKMHKHLFHHRNRLIAALGKATLLIEARRRSGTLITAHQSLQLGRPVWVIPGHPLDVHFGGSLDLLTEGACVIRDAEDLFMYFISEISGKQIQLELPV
jgi:DNA processing protein